MNYMLPRSFYSFEASESDDGPHQERSSLLQHFQKEKEGSDPVTSKKSKHKQSKHSSRELSGKNFIGIFV